MDLIEKTFRIRERQSTVGREVHWGFHVLAVLLLLRYLPGLSG